MPKHLPKDLSEVSISRKVGLGIAKKAVKKQAFTDKKRNLAIIKHLKKEDERNLAAQMKFITGKAEDLPPIPDLFDEEEKKRIVKAKEVFKKTNFPDIRPKPLIDRATLEGLEEGYDEAMEEEAVRKEYEVRQAIAASAEAEGLTPQEAFTMQHAHVVVGRTLPKIAMIIETIVESISIEELMQLSTKDKMSIVSKFSWLYASYYKEPRIKENLLETASKITDATVEDLEKKILEFNDSST